MPGARAEQPPGGGITADAWTKWIERQCPVTRSISLRRRLLAALTAGAWALATPFAAVATPASVDFSITPYPNIVDANGPAFITAGELVAFDVSFTNTSGSTFTGVDLSGTTTPAGAYQYTLVTGGAAANQVACSAAAAGAFTCSVGNLADGADVSLRVVYRTPAITFLPDEPYRDFTLDVLGEGSGAPRTDGDNSRGDTFGGAATVRLVPIFENAITERGAAEYVPTNSGAVIETAGPVTDASNPAWTRVTVRPPGGDAPIGTFGFVKEYADGTPGIPCPAADCIGQAAEIRYLNGEEPTLPIKVEFRLDNAKAEAATPKKVEIFHVLDAGAGVEAIFGDTDQCTLNADKVATNAPCWVSRATASDDKNDYVFVFWLDRNGFIRGG